MRMTLTTTIAALVVLALVLGVAGVWAFQRWGIYFFDMTVSTPEEVGLPRGRAVTYASEDGTPVTAWIAPAEGDRPVILSFQGGYTGTAATTARMLPLAQRGYGLVVMQYRGMGDGAGHPSEANFAMDARALYDQLDTLMGVIVPPERRVVHGLSLGSSVGARLAASRPVGAVVLEASFPEVCRYFERRYFGLPFCRVMWAERNDVAAAVRQIRVPILIAHGENDASVPAAWAEELAAVANEPKRFVVIAGAGHADLDQHGFLDMIDAFLAEILP